MHELSIVQSMIDIVKQQSLDKPLKNLVIRVGMLSCVQPQALTSCFDAIKSQDNLLKCCNLTILETRPVAFCPNCQCRFELACLGQACQCGSFDYDVQGGDDLTLVEMVY